MGFTERRSNEKEQEGEGYAFGAEPLYRRGICLCLRQQVQKVAPDHSAGPYGPAERAEKREVYAMKTVIPIFIVLLYMLFFGWN